MKNTTPVPNAVFELVPVLSEAELKLTLVIIRQTLGWRQSAADNRTRKISDWISGSQFQKKTGMSRRAIVTAVRSLSYRNIIEIADDRGRVLRTPEERKGKPRLYYRMAVDSGVHKPVEN